MKLDLLSKYRTYIMGAAMIWIMIFHSPYMEFGIVGLLQGSSPDGQNALAQFIGDSHNFFHTIGFYGVDMFLLVSGMGLYFSMRKSRSVGEFYKKRALRILPAYLIVTILWYLLFKKDVGFGDAVLSILGVNYFRGSIYGRPPYFDWFIPTLILLYLLTPLYDKLFQKVECKWKVTALASAISPLLCLIAVLTGRQVLEGTFVRIPDFLIGYCIGWFLYEKKEEKKGSWMVHIALLFTGLLLGYAVQFRLKGILTDQSIFWGINAYPAVLAAPAICVTLALIFKYAEKWLRIVGKILLIPFYICGRYSLEIYLLHQRFMEIMASDKMTSFREQMQGFVGNKMYYFLIAVAAVGAGALLHEGIAAVTKWIKGGNNNNKLPAEKKEDKKETNEAKEEPVAAEA